jgi:transposase
MEDNMHMRSEIFLLCKNNPDIVVDLVIQLMERNDQFETQIKELEARLNQDSHNSHQPPSSDKIKQKYPSTNQQKSKRPSGGQVGHKGTTLKRVAHPDVVEKHSVERCSGCGKSLRHVQARSITKRQVIDVPPVKAVVTEHQSETKCCPYCDTVTQAPFPEDVTKVVQYGNRIKSITTYLMQYQLIPADRTTQCMKDLFDCSISEGSLFQWSRELAEETNSSYEAIKGCVAASSVINNDETGVNCEKKNYWFHIASTPLATYLTVHSKRGKEAMDAAGILPAFRGTTVHDMWASYFLYPSRHGLCNAHVIRELTFALEAFHQRWAGKLKRLLCRVHTLVERRRASEIPMLDERTLKRNRARYDTLIAQGLRNNPRQRGSPRVQGRVKQSKVRNLLERLRDHADSVLLFMYDFAVPFTNNLAERDLRMSKVKMKISGCFRSPDGANIYCRIRSYLSTASKNGITIFNAIVAAFNGQPFIAKNVYAE